MITGVNSIRMDDSLISKSDWLLINFSLQHLFELNTKVKNRISDLFLSQNSGFRNFSASYI